MVTYVVFVFLVVVIVGAVVGVIIFIMVDFPGVFLVLFNIAIVIEDDIIIFIINIIIITKILHSESRGYHKNIANPIPT